MKPSDAAVEPRAKPDKDAGSEVCFAHERPHRALGVRTQYGAGYRRYRALVTLPALRQRVQT